MDQRGLNNFFERFLKKETIFLNKKALQSNYTPKTIPHRNEQIKQLANINAPQPRLITIQPWDKEVLAEIEKAIRNQSSLSPVVDGDLIRINIPPLSEDQRKEYVKIINDKTEEARISVRLHREKVWKEIQEMERKGELPKDDKFKAKDDLQELVDDYNKQIEDLRKNKESDIMTI